MDLLFDVLVKEFGGSGYPQEMEVEIVNGLLKGERRDVVANCGAYD